MKRFALTICTAAVLLFSCNDSTTSTDKDKNDSTATTTSPSTSTSGSGDTTTSTAPPDSAAMMKAWMEYMTPGQAHAMMAKWNGTWIQEITMWMTPEAPPTKSTAKSVNSMILGGRYQQSKISGSFDGMPFEGMSTMGYDNAKKVFTSSWIDNMGTGIMLMEGPYDSTSKTISMKGKGIDPTDGKEIEMREVFTLVDDNTQKLEMWCRKDGKEFKTMESTIKRK